MRLTDAIAGAGGLTDFARRSSVRVFHAGGKVEIYDYDHALKDKRSDPVLRPGDRVSVYSPF